MLNAAPAHMGPHHPAHMGPPHFVDLHINPGAHLTFQLTDGNETMLSGPASITMISEYTFPPVPVPVQVPPGHMVHQIVDEHGTLRHIILSLDETSNNVAADGSIPIHPPPAPSLSQLGLVQATPTQQHFPSPTPATGGCHDSHNSRHQHQHQHSHHHHQHHQHHQHRIGNHNHNHSNNNSDNSNHSDTTNQPVPTVVVLDETNATNSGPTDCIKVVEESASTGVDAIGSDLATMTTEDQTNDNETMSACQRCSSPVINNNYTKPNNELSSSHVEKNDKSATATTTTKSTTATTDTPTTPTSANINTTTTAAITTNDSDSDHVDRGADSGIKNNVTSSSRSIQPTSGSGKNSSGTKSDAIMKHIEAISTNTNKIKMKQQDQDDQQQDDNYKTTCDISTADKKESTDNNNSNNINNNNKSSSNNDDDNDTSSGEQQDEQRHKSNKNINNNNRDNKQSILLDEKNETHDNNENNSKDNSISDTMKKEEISLSASGPSESSELLATTTTTTSTSDDNKELKPSTTHESSTNKIVTPATTYSGRNISILKHNDQTTTTTSTTTTTVDTPITAPATYSTIVPTVPITSSHAAMPPPPPPPVPPTYATYAPCCCCCYCAQPGQLVPAPVPATGSPAVPPLRMPSASLTSPAVGGIIPASNTPTTNGIIATFAPGPLQPALLAPTTNQQHVHTGVVPAQSGAAPLGNSSESSLGARPRGRGANSMKQQRSSLSGSNHNNNNSTSNNSNQLQHSHNHPIHNNNNSGGTMSTATGHGSEKASNYIGAYSSIATGSTSSKRGNSTYHQHVSSLGVNNSTNNQHQQQQPPQAHNTNLSYHNNSPVSQYQHNQQSTAQVTGFSKQHQHQQQQQHQQQGSQRSSNVKSTNVNNSIFSSNNLMITTTTSSSSSSAHHHQRTNSVSPTHHNNNSKTSSSHHHNHTHNSHYTDRLADHASYHNQHQHQHQHPHHHHHQHTTSNHHSQQQHQPGLKQGDSGYHNHHHHHHPTAAFIVDDHNVQSSQGKLSHKMFNNDGVHHQTSTSNQRTTSANGQITSNKFIHSQPPMTQHVYHSYKTSSSYQHSSGETTGDLLSGHDAANKQSRQSVFVGPHFGGSGGADPSQPPVWHHQGANMGRGHSSNTTTTTTTNNNRHLANSKPTDSHQYHHQDLGQHHAGYSSSYRDQIKTKDHKECHTNSNQLSSATSNSSFSSSTSSRSHNHNLIHSHFNHANSIYPPGPSTGAAGLMEDQDHSSFITTNSGSQSRRDHQPSSVYHQTATPSQRSGNQSGIATINTKQQQVSIGPKGRQRESAGTTTGSLLMQGQISIKQRPQSVSGKSLAPTSYHHLPGAVLEKSRQIPAQAQGRGLSVTIGSDEAVDRELEVEYSYDIRNHRTGSSPNSKHGAATRGTFKGDQLKGNQSKRFEPHSSQTDEDSARQEQVDTKPYVTSGHGKEDGGKSPVMGPASGNKRGASGKSSKKKQTAKDKATSLGTKATTEKKSCSTSTDGDLSRKHSTTQTTPVATNANQRHHISDSGQNSVSTESSPTITGDSVTSSSKPNGTSGTRQQSSQEQQGDDDVLIVTIDEEDTNNGSTPTNAGAGSNAAKQDNSTRTSAISIEMATVENMIKDSDNNTGDYLRGTRNQNKGSSTSKAAVKSPLTAKNKHHHQHTKGDDERQVVSPTGKYTHVSSDADDDEPNEDEDDDNDERDDDSDDNYCTPSKSTPKHLGESNLVSGHPDRKSSSDGYSSSASTNQVSDSNKETRESAGDQVRSSKRSPKKNSNASLDVSVKNKQTTPVKLAKSARSDNSFVGEVCSQATSGSEAQGHHSDASSSDNNTTDDQDPNEGHDLDQDQDTKSVATTSAETSLDDAGRCGSDSVVIQSASARSSRKNHHQQATQKCHYSSSSRKNQSLSQSRNGPKLTGGSLTQLKILNLHCTSITATSVQLRWSYLQPLAERYGYNTQKFLTEHYVVEMSTRKSSDGASLFCPKVVYQGCGTACKVPRLNAQNLYHFKVRRSTTLSTNLSPPSEHPDQTDQDQDTSTSTASGSKSEPQECLVVSEIISVTLPTVHHHNSNKQRASNNRLSGDGDQHPPTESDDLSPLAGPAANNATTSPGTTGVYVKSSTSQHQQSRHTNRSLSFGFVRSPFLSGIGKALRGSLTSYSDKKAVVLILILFAFFTVILAMFLEYLLSAA